MVAGSPGAQRRRRRRRSRGAFGVDPINLRILLAVRAVRDGTLRHPAVASEIALGALAAASVLFFGAAWATAAGAGLAVAILVLGLGVALVVGGLGLADEADRAAAGGLLVRRG